MTVPSSSSVPGALDAVGVAPSERALAAALVLAPTPVLLVTTDGGALQVPWANAAAWRLLDASPGGRVQSPEVRFVVGDAKEPEEHDALAGLLEAGGGRRTLTLVRRDGSTVPVRVHALGANDLPGAWVVYVEELTEVRRATEERQASDTRFHTLASRVPAGILVSEAGLRLGFANDLAAELLDTCGADLHSASWIERVDARDRDDVVDALMATLGGTPADCTFRVADQLRWLRMIAAPVPTQARGGGFIATLEDITVERAHQAALTHQATHDQLTGLPNRVALRTALTAAAEDRRASSVALLFFDLDHFKIVNDSLGHAVGDLLLVEVTRRLQAQVRHGDLLTRFGGDEFVMLCREVDEVAEAVVVAERMHAALSEPVVLQGRPFSVSASVGIVHAARGTDWSADSLLRDADTAMYEAKEGGRARFSVFDDHARVRATHRMRVATDLRRAIGAGELTLVYQPIVPHDPTASLGAEALLRWRHADHGEVPIGELIAVAEETGLMHELGAWVLETACADLAAWRHERVPRPAWVSVNVSPTQLTDGSFPVAVEAVVARHGLLPTDIALELTEHVLVDPDATSIGALQRLHAGGFRITLDDFGTGWSSLAYLKSMPVDVIKIAAQFVAGLTTDPADAAIAEAIVRMAKAVGCTVVAEGVETVEQRDALAQLGCPYVQGYLLGRPAARKDLPAVLDRLALGVA